MNLKNLQTIAIAIFFLWMPMHLNAVNSEFLSLASKEKVRNGTPPLKRGYVFSKYYGGRLGNQLFQIAAALSLAMDNNALAVFPDYSARKDYDIVENRKYVFPNICTQNPYVKPYFTFKEHQDFHFQPIPFTPNMAIGGFFQSEKYFKHNWKKIRPYFAPSNEIICYLQSKYFDLLSHQNTVGLHIRAYLKEASNLKKMFVTLDENYFEQAASLFGNDALFVIFSDNIPEAKTLLKNFSRPYVIIEGEKHYHDFYLMSLMKHQIISNSSFSWWAAYLNNNPGKIVIAPYPWFHPQHHLSSEHLIAEDWITLPIPGY